MTPDWRLLSLPRSRVRSKKTQPCHLMTCKSICRDGSRSILRLESETRDQTTARRGSLSIWSRTAADTAGLLHSISADISFSRSLSLSLSPTSLLSPPSSSHGTLTLLALTSESILVVVVVVPNLLGQVRSEGEQEEYKLRREGGWSHLALLLLLVPSHLIPYSS